MIHKIRNEEILGALRRHAKQYLTGNLKKPQELEHVPSSHVEIGMTRMRQGERERPHYHPVQSEFVYVLDGTFEVVELSTDQTHTLRKGDFLAIEGNTRYAQHAVTNCLLFFAKCPSVDDKIELDQDM